MSEKVWPLVSVITVVFNRKATIEQCLHSVQAQTYPNIEHIVIDGASTDGTVEIVGRHLSRVAKFVSEPDRGIYHAMNKGIGLAVGEYIIFLNSDDWYSQDAIEKLVNAALSSRSDVVHGNAYAVTDSGAVMGEIGAWLHDGIYTRGMPLRHETMLVKRAIYEGFGGYDESYRILADYAYVTRLYDKGCSFFYLPVPLLFFRMSGISNNDEQTRRLERVRFFQSWFPFLSVPDLELMSRGATMKDRFYLLKKYHGKSRRFTLSMLANLRASAADGMTKFLRRRRTRFIRSILTYARRFF